MPTPKKIIRGMQDIRSISGRVDQAALLYKGYMKLSCLEMEKFRRGKERSSAMQRVNNIDSRFNDIDAKKKMLLRALGDLENGENKQKDIEHNQSHRRSSTAGLKIRY